MNLLDLSTPYIAPMYKSHPERLGQQAEEHTEILAACRERNSERAYAAGLRHLSALKVTDPSGTSITTFERKGLLEHMRIHDIRAHRLPPHDAHG